MKINKQIIDKAFSCTGKGKKDIDKIKIDILREEYIKIFNKDNERYNYYLSTLKNWEKDLMLKGEVDDKIIKMNEERPGFRRDRDCYIDGIFYRDRWFSTFMLMINDCMEEKVTLSLFRKNNNNFNFYLEENKDAPTIDSIQNINGQPDFIIVDKESKKVGYVEQKSIYNYKNQIYIRKSQHDLFKEMSDYNYLYILTKEHDKEKIIYKFYDYEKIYPILKTDYNRGYYFLKNEIEPTYTYIDSLKIE